MDSFVLTDANFTMYAIKHYDNPNCSGEDEFMADIARIASIKRLIMKYKRDGELKERLILNHLIVLYNLFGEAATKMIVFKLPEDMYPIIKTFMLFLDRVPENSVRGLEKLYDAGVDLNISNALRKL